MGKGRRDARSGLGDDAQFLGDEVKIGAAVVRVADAGEKELELVLNGDRHFAGCLWWLVSGQELG